MYRPRAIALLVEALCYKPEDFLFDSRWNHEVFLFQFTKAFQMLGGHGADLASYRNEYLKFSRGVTSGRHVKRQLHRLLRSDCLRKWQRSRRHTTLWVSTAYHTRNLTLFRGEPSVSQLINNFPTFYGTRSFSTMKNGVFWVVTPCGSCMNHVPCSQKPSAGP
jgi:hypothetical protein